MLSDIDFRCPECGASMSEFVCAESGSEYEGETLIACPKAVSTATTVEPYKSDNPAHLGYSFFKMPAIPTVRKGRHGPPQFYLLSKLLAKAEALLGQEAVA